MRSGARRGVIVVSIVTTLLSLGAPASASPPPPADLHVEGGEETWHPQRRFRVVWRNPAPSGGPPLAAVHYRVRDPAGTVAIGATRIDWPAVSIEGLEVPGPPGAYTAEVWLEDAAGDAGAPAAVKLRFDNEHPGRVEPVTTATWIGRVAFPLTVRLSHPDGEPPVSGIRGYAVSVAPPPGRSPCGAPDRCTEAETDLRGGPGDNSFAIADLREGTSYLQAVAVSGSGMTSATPGRAVLRVDKTSPAMRLRGAPEGWANHPVLLTATAEDDGSGMAPDGHGTPPFTAIAVDGGTPTTASGPTVRATVIGEGVHRVAYYARDLAGNVDDGGEDNGLPNPPPPTALVRIDRGPPDVSFVNSQDPSHPELVRARVSDPVSGPDPGRGWIGVRRVGSGDRFAALPEAPSAQSGELRARWDSDAYAAGEYEFRAVGYDAAGNATATTRRANGAAMVLSNPLKATTALRAAFGGRTPAWHRCAKRGGRRRCQREAVRELSRRPSSRTVTYGRGVVFSGLLTTGVSAPLGRMPVRILERFATPTGSDVRASTVITDPGGAFAIRLSPGPSREVTAAFDGLPTLTRSTSPSVRLAVRSAVKLRVSSSVARIGGPPVVFRGRVAAATGTIPPDGKSVQLQFRLPGLPWSEFRTIQTDRGGYFRYAYRFSDDDSHGTRFQFRAYAPPQGGWPYEPGGSRPVAVRGE